MSARKNYSYTVNVAQPITHATTIGHFQTRLIHLKSVLSGLLTHQHKKESQPNMEVDFELSNERHVEGGYYRVSPKQSALERTIELSWVTLRMKRNL